MLALIVAASVWSSAPLPSQLPDPAAKAIVDTALSRMGGRESLARAQRARREMLTMWQRVNFRQEPYSDAPTYEMHTDVRDYGLRAWRNTRKFGVAATAQQIVDIVLDTVAIRQMPNGVWGPLNIAYVDERREVFAIAPEYLLLVADDAPDLALGRDTLIDGLPAARVTATVDGFRMTLLFRRGDGLLAMSRFRAAQPNDFGLVGWGTMEVETWYSRWSRTAVGAVLPSQIDQKRLGRPYKRMTVLSAAFDTVTTAETFAISDSLRAAFFAGATKPMHDLPLDSAKIFEGKFVNFATFGAPAGAVKLGGKWVLFEAGQGGISATRALDWLARIDPGASVAGAILTLSSSGNGGVTELGRRRVPTYVALGSRPLIDRMLGNTGATGVSPVTVGPVTVTRARWLAVGTDSLWLEPIGLPDAPRNLLVYSPTLQWVYNAGASAPLQAQYLLDRVKEHGWTATRVGHARAMIPPPVPAAR
jgi:hypothetical protein